MGTEVGVIIVAGGSGKRMNGTAGEVAGAASAAGGGQAADAVGGGQTVRARAAADAGQAQGGRPKQFMMLAGRPVLGHTIDAFAAALPGAEIVVVLSLQHIEFWKNLAARFDIAEHTIAAGGAERFHSVQNGIAALRREAELIAIHDGVRPLATAELIRRTVDAASRYGAAVPVVEIFDSLRMVETATEGAATAESEGAGTSSHPVDRRTLRIVQTPQVFGAGLLRKAYEIPYNPSLTDDASVVEQSGHAIFLCRGERANIKITTPDDLIVAEALLAAREEAHEEEGAGTVAYAPAHGQNPDNDGKNI